MVEAGVGRRNPNERYEPVLVADAPQALVGTVEGKIADPRVGQQTALLASINVDRVDVAIGVVLVDVEGRAAVGIEGDARHFVEHHSVEIREVRDLAGGEIHLPQKADLAGPPEGRDEAVGLLVDETPRHRT
jgi:hypothetical protein